MKRYLIPLLGLMAISTARGAVTLTFSDTSGAPGSVTVNPGDTFDVILTLSSTAEMTSGISYLMEAFGSASSGFAIMARDVTGSAFGDVIVTDGIALAGTAGFLDPVNDNELGGLTAGPPNGMGDFRVAAFTIQALPGIAPGDYTIGTSGAVAFDDAFNDIILDGASYDISVVPEPAGTLLGGLALGAALLRRRRPTDGGR